MELFIKFQYKASLRGKNRTHAGGVDLHGCFQRWRKEKMKNNESVIGILFHSPLDAAGGVACRKRLDLGKGDEVEIVLNGMLEAGGGNGKVDRIL